MDSYIDLTKKQYDALMHLESNGPLQMVNLLKFKPHVPETDKTGKEQYKDYMKAVLPYFEAANAKTIYFGDPKMNLIGPDNLEWDKLLIIEYQSKTDFISMITAKGYPSEMRRLALEDSRLIICSD